MMFVARDTEEILGVFDNLEDAFQHVLECVHVHARYSRQYDAPPHDLSQAITNILRSTQIVEYRGHLATNVHVIDVSDGKVALRDSRLQPRVFEGFGIQDRLAKIGRVLSRGEVDAADSEINLFIPMQDTVAPAVDLDELKERIEILTRLKEEEDRKLLELDEEYKKRETKYMKEKTKMDKVKLRMKREQEKWDSIQKKFEADKKLYFIFKHEIEAGTRAVGDIPILFRETFPIFEQLEKEHHLDTPYEINKYMELTKQLPGDDAPHTMSDLFKESDMNARYYDERLSSEDSTL
jgi:hypothetical protein